MGQMAAQVIGITLFMLLAFSATVSAVGERQEGGKSDYAGHSSPSFACSINKQVILFKLIKYILPQNTASNVFF